MRRWPFVVLILVVIVVALSAVQVFRPIPAMALANNVPSTYRVPGQLQVNWPSEGAAALSVSGVGLMGEKNGNQQAPIASLTKMMTAYLVLKHHPLAYGQQGPVLTVTPQDVQTYQADYNNGDSVVKVAVGEKLSEYQLLEALLLPSGDNIATLLANWVDGNTANFIREMNQTAKTMGMTNTHYADVAGVNPLTVSTALDQLKIAEIDMQNQVFRQIVASAQVSLPVAGLQYNVDYDVGHDGIVGIKTGSTPQAGGNFVFARYATVGANQVLVIGDVMGQQAGNPLMTALAYGKSLASEAIANLRQVKVVASGNVDATIDAPWAKQVSAAGTSGVNLVGWPGMVVHTTLQSDLSGHSVKAGQIVGHLIVSTNGERVPVSLKATKAILPPSLVWKLERVPSASHP